MTAASDQALDVTLVPIIRPNENDRRTGLYGHNYRLPFRQRGHNFSNEESRDRPNDIEKATRAQVKASKEHEETEAKYQECRRKYEDDKKKLYEATKRLNNAKRGCSDPLSCSASLMLKFQPSVSEFYTLTFTLSSELRLNITLQYGFVLGNGFQVFGPQSVLL
ncbi:hypothetical protein BU23DRAFT_603968 [Bimuria novae-zelandiae CBS 107.79]|uniref:Uncharacterized protein n=1 Tax=Bimuria novae-zelandiae CBS 107.79 TaxID=1447943 RepID=A0A6A5ULJ3_9PLEO|nr:hypothetical protein BU23DRAFT_603968 [Bimuria novae-zelandiae CBS 107.79]